MRQYSYIMPEQCMECGATFDLYYEFLESKERLESEEIQEKLGRKLAEYLCWECKKELIKDFKNSPASDNINIDNENSSEELDLFLDIE